VNRVKPVLIAIGSNIGRERNLPQALARLGQHPHIVLRVVSPTYESLPVGGSSGQPPFFNAAALIETNLEPSELKEALLAIECNLGRVRTADKYAPRPIDLDIALYDRDVLDIGGRRIPDPDLARFPHVALPVADVAPDWIHPELGETLAEIANNLHFSDKEIRKL
jgi:2-amino-4-hydroxy-6-hydroxymethyldihydropteridine diphosphokinase